nr:Retrovirus-related Pol polyprotein from transposon TNT 1-94 [Ipomoea trifida]
MSFDESLFKEIDKTVISKVKIGNGRYIEVKGKGTVAIEGPSGIKLIPDVMLVPKISQNLLSVGQLLEKGYFVIFKNKMCFITDSFGAELFSVKMKDKSFCLDWDEAEFKAYPCVVSQAELWHKRLWHFHYSTLEYMQKKEIVRGMSFTGGVAAVCEICQLGKQTRLPFPVEKTWRATEKIKLIHTGGGMKNVSINDSKYFILFIDDFTRMCWVYFLKQKSEVADVFWKFKSWIEHQFTVIYTLQQNGVSERKNRTVIDMTQCLLFEKGMPKKFYYWIWSTFLCQNEKFNKDDGSEKVDETSYSSIIGCLIFLTSTRPVIMFSMAQEEATTIFVDNQAAIAVSRNSVFHGKTKHFKVKLYFVREVQKTNEVNLVRCSTGVQLADILTKGLPRSRFEVLREKIGVCSKNSKEE